MKATSALTLSKKTASVFVLFAAWCAICQANTLVGTLPGDFSVDNKGAANYTVPLQIPPGRAGMQPHIALHYNSNGGNGPLGIGFSLSTGFPQSITRGRSILARDGVVRGVKFDADDRLYLDGKLLICISGAYGQPGSVYRTEVDSFVTITASGTANNIEGFRMITNNGTMLCFGKNVKDAANAPVYTDSDGYHMLGGETTGRAFAWALKWVEDAIGNYIAFRYDEMIKNGTSFGEGEHVLTSIHYSGNRKQSIGPQFSVSLYCNDPQNLSGISSANPRPDGGVLYQYGRKTAMNSRLDRIIVHAFANPVSSPICVYSLKYKTSAEHASLKLESIRLEDHSANVITTRSTELAWGDIPGQLGDVKSMDGPGFVTQSKFIGDFNGDGRKDVLGRKLSSPPSPFTYFSGFIDPHFAFVDDAKTIVSMPTIMPNDLVVEHNKNNKYVYPRIYSSGDFNGDGKTDLVFKMYDLNFAGSGGWYLSLSTGTGFTDAGAKIIDDGTINELLVHGPELITDINGDGLDDLIYKKQSEKIFPGIIEDDESSIAFSYFQGMAFCNVIIPHNIFYVKSPVISSGSLGYTEEYSIPIPYPLSLRSSTAYLPMDINGDGLTDFLATEMAFNRIADTGDGLSPYYGKSCKLWSAINTGNNTLEAMPISGMEEYEIRNGTKLKLWDWRERYYDDDTGTPSGEPGASTYVIGDVNGDGLDDIVFFRLRVKMAQLPDEPDPINGWTVFLSRGDGTFDDKSFKPPPMSLAAGGRENVPTYHMRQKISTSNEFEGFDIRGVILMDYNNDGKKDFVWRADAQAGWQCLLATHNGFAKTPIAIQARPSQGTASFDYHRQFLSLGGAVLFSSDFGFLTQSTDMDGDGRDDILLLEHAGSNKDLETRSIHCIFSPSSDANRIVAIKDGLGATTRIEYTPITRDSVYTPGAPVSYPIREDRRPQHVVSNVHKDSGSDTPSDHAHFSYQYSGNRLDLSGRGSLGFHSFVTLDHQTGLFKYQFLTQSFPMTGLTMREQTYRFWDDTKFRLISSHDNTVVFDKVVNPANPSQAWGTVYPFISAAVESRWENSPTPHYTLTPSSTNSASSQSETIFTQVKPGGAHITISATSLFDNQTSAQTTLPGSLYKPSDLIVTGGTSANTVAGYLNYSDFQKLAFPQKITHGNLTRLTTDFGDGFTETVATTYHAPTSNGLTGLVAAVATTVVSTTYGTQAAPVKSYTYWTNGSTPTPLVSTETLTATDSTLNTTTTYTRDSLGRITSTAIAGYDNPNDPRHVGSYTTSKATAFDARFDLPTTTLNTYDHTTFTAYHGIFALPTSVTDVNGAEITTAYDPLGRAIRIRNELLNLQTDTTYAWTTSSASDWQTTQTVSPPSNHPGALTLSSVFAIRTAATAQPAVTTYHDRIGRPIRTIKEGFNGQSVYTDTIYNNLGQIVATSLPYPSESTPLWTTTTYDALGRVSRTIAPNGTETTYKYAGRATAVTIDAPDREPQTNVTLVDAKGRTVKVWNADITPQPNTLPSSLDTLNGLSTKASIEYKLDGFGLMRETILRGQSQKILATYDALGRQTSLNDPDKGNWTYVNNALGQVVQQTDAKGNTTLSTFDRLARPLTRSTAEAGNGPFDTARWYYFDTVADESRHLVTQGNKGWIGALQREEVTTTGAPGYAAVMPATTTAYYYDSKGRPEITLRTIDNKWFYTNTAYDQYNRVSQVSHYWRPANDEHGIQDPIAWEDFGYTYTYNNQSYLLALHDTTPQARAWWQADATSGYDHLDRPVLVRKGNAHWTQRTYRPEDGVITNIKTGPTAGGAAIQNLFYDFDGLGNLTSRGNGSLSETFTYDNLNRLTTRNGATIATYADNGNITSKVDVSGNQSGNYAYDSAKPHAVTSAWGYSMTYDSNGNMLTRTGNGSTWTTQWTGFDKPRWLAKTAGNGATTGSEFLYNANRSRVMHMEFDAMTNGVPSHYTRKKIYAAGPDIEVYYTNIADAGTPRWLRKSVRVYLNAPDGPVGTMEYKETGGAPVGKALVYHTDHLGSMESITEWGDTTTALALDSTGKPSLYSYDPWGERRDPSSWFGPPISTDTGGPLGVASRGFTSHEMLDGLGLVHMNGRIYDPLLGRMLSADPIVQYPSNLQSYNRYSYVFNNPLANTDPSGHIAVPVGGALVVGGAVVVLATGAYTISTPQGKDASVAVTRAGSGFFGRIRDGVKSLAALGLGAVATLTGKIANNDIATPVGGDGGQIANTQKNDTTTLVEQPPLVMGDPPIDPKKLIQDEYIPATTAADVAVTESFPDDTGLISTDIVDPIPDPIAGDTFTSDVTQKLPDADITEAPGARGQAPIGKDGHPIELHHAEQASGNASSLQEITRTDHRLGDNYKKNHLNTGQEASTVNRVEFSRIRRTYWAEEWDSGRFNDTP